MKEMGRVMGLVALTVGFATFGAYLGRNLGGAGWFVAWLLALGWGFAAALGAVSGMMVAPTVFLTPNMMQAVLIYAFAAAVLGGLESPIGAVVGGLALGVTLNLLGTYVHPVTSELRLPVALGVLLVVLLIKPAGLFGRVVVRRV